MSNKAIKVIIKEPCKSAEVTVINNSLSTLQKIVGGDIELCTPTGIHGVGCYINGTGKLTGLCPNLLITDKRRRWRDTIVGCAVFFGMDCDIEVSLSDNQIDEVMQWISEHALVKTN